MKKEVERFALDIAEPDDDLVRDLAEVVHDGLLVVDQRSGYFAIEHDLAELGTTSMTHMKGQVPCSGAVLRVAASGGEPELVAWGFRNPFGLAFTRGGMLLVTDNGYDVRGSRPVWGNADWRWIVNPNESPRWFGWPEYADGNKLTETRCKPADGPQPRRLIADDPNPRAGSRPRAASTRALVERPTNMSSCFNPLGFACALAIGGGMLLVPADTHLVAF